MEYYSAGTKNEVLMYAAAWMNLDKTCQVKEATHNGPQIIGFYFQETSRIRKFPQKVDQGMRAEDLGWEARSDCCQAWGFFSGDDNVLKSDCPAGHG